MSDRSSCPRCGSDKVVPLLYGLPPSEWVEAAGRGEITLGGPVIREGMPTRLCAACGHRFGRWHPRPAGRAGERADEPTAESAEPPDEEGATEDEEDGPRDTPGDDRQG